MNQQLLTQKSKLLITEYLDVLNYFIGKRELELNNLSSITGNKEEIYKEVSNRQGQLLALKKLLTSIEHEAKK